MLEINKDNNANSLVNEKFYEDDIKKKLNLFFEQKNFDEVIKLSKFLIKKHPSNSTLYLIMGVAYINLKNYKSGEKQLKKSIKLNPNNPNAYNDLGVCLINLKKYEEAIFNLEKSIQLQNFYPEAYNNIALAYQNKGDTENAILNYEISIKQNPKYAKALSNLGLLMTDINEINKAIKHLVNAIEADQNSQSSWYNLGLTLKNFHPVNYDNKLADLYVKLLNKKIPLDPKDLIFSSLAMIKTHSIFSLKIEKLSIDDFELELKVCEALSNIELLLQIMKISPIVDIQIEKLFVKIRRSILLNLNQFPKNKEITDFLIALSCQCYLNEYIYPETSEEQIAISNIEQKLFSKSNDMLSLDAFSIAVLSSYRPLNKYTLLEEKPHEKDLHLVYKEQIDNFHEEKLIATKINKLTKIKDNISLTIKSQYEENPYPRWNKCGQLFPYKSIYDFKNSLLLKEKNHELKNIDKLDILIAGCGTGKQAITTATRFPDSKILAIDLSNSSLAFAIRKAKELKIDNIEFMSGDIIELRDFKKKFDIIECCGVLHHLKNPSDGLSILNNLLKKKGLMYLSLYSEHARSSINIAKKVINNANLTNSKQDILKFRNYVINIDDELLNPLIYRQEHNKKINISDFYSLSEFRDLVFNEVEHHFNLEKIKKIIEKEKLEFIGFEIDKSVLEEFINNFGKNQLYSLVSWDKHEKENNNIFLGMYHIWLQKI